MEKLFCFCIFFAAAAHSFAGEWISDEKTGCQIWNRFPNPGDSASWSGKCVNGKASGRGVLQWYQNGNPKDRYEGEVRNGQANGKGIITWSNDDHYEGEWKDNNRHGNGIYTSPLGDRYEGEWRDDLYNGKGIYTKTNMYRYEGEWRSGRRHGFGKLITQRSAVNASENSSLGKWVNDTYVEQGLFENFKLILSCSSKANCLAEQRRQAPTRANQEQDRRIQDQERRMQRMNWRIQYVSRPWHDIGGGLYMQTIAAQCGDGENVFIEEAKDSQVYNAYISGRSSSSFNSVSEALNNYCR